MEKKEWFAEWFDSKYYHILYQNRDHQEAERFIKNVVQYLKMPKESVVLDLACGKGRHSLMLHELGMHATGVDLSPQSIESARQFETKNLEFAVHDMRKVYRENHFDYVLNLFTSFGYFDHQDDNLSMLKGIEKDLKAEGTVLIDFMNANKVIKNLVNQEVKTLDDIEFNITRKYDGEHIFKNIQFSSDDQNYHYTERVQALQLSDFENLFSATQLQIIDIFGDYNLNAYDEQSSDRLIIIAKK